MTLYYTTTLQAYYGKTYDEIAEKVGTSTSTVSKLGQVIKYPICK